MNLRQVVKSLTPPIVIDTIRAYSKKDTVQLYLRSGRVPWSQGYSVYRTQLIVSVLRNESLLGLFRRGMPLPPGYGVGIDERCIEYPWLVAHTHEGPGNYLDAGSTLNHEFILDHPVFRQKVMHILTLAPEANCFWHRRISYLYHDLREIPLRDAYFDTIACLSTLEHVGCDNTVYTQRDAHREHCVDDFVFAIREFARVLKPGGSLLLTVPFGKHRYFGPFQQFDRRLLSRAVEAFGKAEGVAETFYRYTAEGWNVADVADCAECEYVEWITQATDQWPNPLPVEPDRAAAARAVACVRLIKG